MKDRYVFLRTAEKDGKVVALIGDSKILGDAGIRSLRLAFTAHATPISRAGVLTMTAEQLTKRLPELEEKKMHESAEAFRRAIECVEKKSGKAPGPGDHKPHSVETTPRENDPNLRFSDPPPSAR
ncbi:MAG: hypothetical protein K8R48_00355 [Alphaproteobacteria bacterium]|nr:hypothetical protein [Alphaproteobacteria bacterium]